MAGSGTNDNVECTSGFWTRKDFPYRPRNLLSITCFPASLSLSLTLSLVRPRSLTSSSERVSLSLSLWIVGWVDRPSVRASVSVPPLSSCCIRVSFSWAGCPSLACCSLRQRRRSLACRSTSTGGGISLVWTAAEGALLPLSTDVCTIQCRRRRNNDACV